MIWVDLYVSEEGVYGFKIKGHAGMAPQGEDVVCAGVSAVAQTAILGLNAFLPGDFCWEIKEDGYMACFILEGASAERRKASRIILETLKLGLESMGESYGEYLRIRNRR
jgi:uncharacterized protein YsxB (DUF464 family)